LNRLERSCKIKLDLMSGTFWRCVEHGKMIAQKMFNNWDEVGTIMRKLISTGLNLRPKWHEDHWEYE
jgi:hypothetical protein